MCSCLFITRAGNQADPTDDPVAKPRDRRTKAQIASDCKKKHDIEPGTGLKPKQICQSKAKVPIQTTETSKKVPVKASTSAQPKNPQTNSNITNQPTELEQVTSNKCPRFDSSTLAFVIDYMSTESNQDKLSGSGSKTKVGAMSCGAEWNLFATHVKIYYND
ncbi:uncharacterized protein MELLADRAFT_110768 [Melampsora larici-populina 98AG31]|uniref:Uncharacterized protein n=1 Tax=Melampsora larici-populina (strain 98AG31 / pathotype 3-4-7) TaxID=747676 RepID=F4S0W9_MELLP|nr:uncharacterized protein MELLADRAFT_110768 [Melampsora larici-populina 98AG31]EGG01737.1 hypothetical protein MELLADRAFT_110768 [Melampsora larici-populina 98AG31]